MEISWTLKKMDVTRGTNKDDSIDNEKVSNQCERRTIEKVLRLDTSQLVRNVWDKVTKSYKETAQNLNDFVQNKLEYVASIRL